MYFFYSSPKPLIFLSSFPSRLNKINKFPVVLKHENFSIEGIKFATSEPVNLKCQSRNSFVTLSAVVTSAHIMRILTITQQIPNDFCLYRFAILQMELDRAYSHASLASMSQISLF